MEPDHPYYKTIVEDSRYKDGPSPDEFPKYESLKLTIARTLPYWNDEIVPQIKAGKRVLIAAHGNSLRGIVKYLDSKKNKLRHRSNLNIGDYSSLFSLYLLLRSSINCIILGS